MLGRIASAMAIIVVMLAFLPGFNTFLRDITDNVISELPGVTSFELAYWQTVPLLLAVFFLILVPFWLITNRYRRGRRNEEDDIRRQL